MRYSKAMEVDIELPDAGDNQLSSSSHTEPSWTQIQAASSQISLPFRPQTPPLEFEEIETRPAWDDPLRRASRWLDEDSCHTFYHTVLKDLALPTTRSREVANWRIKKSINTAANAGKPLPVQLPRYVNHHLVAGVDSFIQEQPSGELRSERAYDVVMRCWISVRSPYLPPPSRPDNRAAVFREDTAPLSVFCSQCKRKLRLCRCFACHVCGELPSECLCLRCEDCGRHNSDCACTPVVKQMAEEKKLIPQRMRQWIDANKTSPVTPRSSISPMQRTGTGPQLLNPYELCGTYIVLTSAAVYDDLKRSEIVVSYSSVEDCMYGRYRHGEDVHGLFRTKEAPVRASTLPIPCVVAVEDAKLKDGTWVFDVFSETQPFRYPSPDYLSGMYYKGGVPVSYSTGTLGITFLSRNLLVLGSHFLGHRRDLAPAEAPHAVFGVKVDENCEDVDALRESWTAIHREYCDWYECGIIEREVTREGSSYDRGDADHFRQSDQEASEGDTGAEWDEELIDGLVNQLFCQE